MKRVFSLLLVFTLIAALALPVFAGYEAGAKSDTRSTFEIPKANTSPTIDGNLEGDTYKELAYSKDSLSYAWGDTDFTDADAKAVNWKLYGCYDDKYIYIGITCEAPSDKYKNDLDQSGAGNIWQQTGVQVGLAPTSASANEFIELGYARNSTSGEEICTRWLESPTSKDDFTPEAGKGDFKVTYANNTLTYEVKVAWTAFQGADAKQGDKVLLGVVVARGAGDQHLHSQLGYGITGDPGKNADGFSELTLGAAPAVVVPEPVAVEAPAAVEAAPAPAAPAAVVAAPAPATGDGAVAIFVLAAVAGIGACVVAKKKR